MEKYIILADISCDLPADLRQRFGVKDYLRGHVHLADGREILSSLDWDEVDPKVFYKELASKTTQISTSAPNVEEFYAKFEKYVNEGYKILNMTISSKISSTYDFSCVAAKRIKEKYPDSTIYCLDTSRMSTAFGLLVIYAHLLQKEGKSFEEVIQWVETNKARVHQMGSVDNLLVVAKRGRLTMGKAIMGSFVGVKPMGDFNNDGYISVLTKVKGMNKAIDTTVKYVKEMATNIKDQYVFVTHTDREELALKMKERIVSELSPKEVFLTQAFCSCGTNIGPGMVAVYFMGEPISEDLVREKEVINKILGKE